MSVESVALKNFLSRHRVQDVKRACEGELFEESDEFATYWFGNGELTILPVDSEDEFTFHVSNARGFDELVKD